MCTWMAIRGVEASSSKTYMQEVRGALRGCATDVPVAQAVERRFGELAREGYRRPRTWWWASGDWNACSSSPPPSPTSTGCSLRRSARWPQQKTDHEYGRQQKISKRWQSTGYSGCGPGCSLRSEWRPPCASKYQMWRSCVGGGWSTGTGWCSFDYKVAKEMCAQPIPPFWERWREWLFQHRQLHHHDGTLFLPGGTDSLRKLQQEMFKGTECSLSCWHPWKRMGVACFRALGGSLQALTIWARWRIP